jgi:hypothetical protein
MENFLKLNSLILIIIREIKTLNNEPIISIKEKSEKKPIKLNIP